MQDASFCCCDSRASYPDVLVSLRQKGQKHGAVGAVVGLVVGLGEGAELGTCRSSISITTVCMTRVLRQASRSPSR